jgi:hypothetical protein
MQQLANRASPSLGLLPQAGGGEAHQLEHGSQAILRGRHRAGPSLCGDEMEIAQPARGVHGAADRWSPGDELFMMSRF